MAGSALKRSHGLPEGISFWHPAALVSTWFGVGLMPKAPGTWGSLAALPIAWVVAERYGAWAVVALGVVLFALGMWSTTAYLHHSRAQDPSEVVVDEVAAQMLACAPAGLDPVAFTLAFILFRVFDVMKPWPCGALERGLPGALGVMADDIAAALYAAAMVELYFIVLGRAHGFA